MIERTVRNRTCARDGCSQLFDPFNRDDGTPTRFCSQECARGKGRKVIQAKRKAISPASPAQRSVIRDRACIVCAKHAGHCDPAHLIARGALTEGQDEPRAVVPLCRGCHDLYDEGGMDLLPYLEPHWRTEIAYAVERYGLLRALQRVTNSEWSPVEREGRRDAA